MRRLPGLSAALILMAGGAQAAPAARTVIAPVPEAREIPATAPAHPFLATRHNMVPFDLAPVGYEEVEAFVSGRANVYDWGADGRPEIRSGGAPYATRILVRRPADKSKFSGVVVVEPMLDARSSDWAMMWGYLHDKIVRDGDVWVGVTLPKSIGSLKKFDAARYAPLAFAPATPLACKTGEAGDTLEEGLRFDMLAQVGALLKSSSPTNPLAAYGPSRRLFMTEQGGDANTYATVFQTLLRLPGGKPVYDGFMLKTQGAAIPKLNHCGQAVPAGDPRGALKGVGVPVIAVMAPGEVVGFQASRRDDSDDKADPYRRYEVAAGNHLDRYAYSGFPSFEDQAKAGVAQGAPEWPFANQCSPAIQLSGLPVMKYAFDTALSHLAAWSRDGTPPPRAPRIALKPGGRFVELDANGIAVGGVRGVHADLPISADALGAPGPGNCREIGGTVAYSWPYLTKLYGTPKARAATALAEVDAMVKARWLTPGDADLLRAEITAPPKPPVVPAS